MEKRIFGRTNEELSIIGFGGMLVAKEDQTDADNYVSEAIDYGINYFDVAPTYFDAEDKLGPALEAYRNNIFLACKTEDRTKKGSEILLYSSLKKMRTDHFDLYQLHAMSTMEDVERAFGADGAMETYIKAKKEGIIRYIGFSAHSEEVALELLDRYEFDSMLLPINWAGIINSNYGVRAIKKAEEKGTARLSIKAMARNAYNDESKVRYDKTWYEPVDNEYLACLALRYTLSLPITAAIPPGEMKFFRWAAKTALDFKPITDNETEELKQAAMGIDPLFK